MTPPTNENEKRSQKTANGSADIAKKRELQRFILSCESFDAQVDAEKLATIAKIETLGGLLFADRVLKCSKSAVCVIIDIITKRKSPVTA